MSDDKISSNSNARELRSRITALRQALHVAISPCVKERLGGREAARQLGLDKTLGWKVFQLAFSLDDEDAVKHIPGPRAWGKIIAALEQNGTSASTMVDLRTAIDALEAILLSSKLKRGAIADIFLNGTVSSASARRLLRIRKDASQTASSILGVRIAARVGCFLVAPSQAAHKVDVAVMALIQGPEFLSSRAPVRLYVPMTSWTESRASIDDVRAGEGAKQHALYPLILDLSSPNISQDELQRDPLNNRKSVDFLGARADRTEPLYLSFSEIQRETGSMYRESDDSWATLALPIELPIDLVVFDVCVHREIPIDDRIDAGIIDSRIPRRDGDQLIVDQRIRTEEQIVEINSLDLPAPIAGHSATYHELVRRGAAELRTTIADYRFHRFAISYPPIKSLLMARWKLPEPPSQ